VAYARQSRHSKEVALAGPGPAAVYDSIISDLKAKAANAANRNKPTMWAYYGDMVACLTEWFSDVDRQGDADGGFAGAALALSQLAEEQCPTLPPVESSRLWAMSVYARRILKAWGAGSERVSLDWLRKRANDIPAPSRVNGKGFAA
jgi:hypothetical protein